MMKLKAIAAATALLGIGASVAVAKGPLPAHPASGTSFGVCHRTAATAGPSRFVGVPRADVEAHMRHGDRLATSGACPGTLSAAP